MAAKQPPKNVKVLAIWRLRLKMSRYSLFGVYGECSEPLINMGREEERARTEQERLRADQEHPRAEQAEEKVRQLEALLKEKN